MGYQAIEDTIIMPMVTYHVRIWDKPRIIVRFPGCGLFRLTLIRRKVRSNSAAEPLLLLVQA